MEKLLFTPGPLTTSNAVKSVMNRDLGSRDDEFIRIIKSIRVKLLEIAGLSGEQEYDSVILQGSGTFGIESVITSSVPTRGKILIIINGSYGERMVKICQAAKISYSELRYPENEIPNLNEINSTLNEDKKISHVAVVHCETTTGIINPILEIGQITRGHDKTYIVDAMSSFGGIPINIPQSNIDFLISSSNKCIEGVPGFSFILATKKELIRCKRRARSLSLDLYAQWEGLEKNGQFRFTPPVQVLVAFNEALHQLEVEGGISARADRYIENHLELVNGMEKLGFKPYLPRENQGYIITTFCLPDDPKFDNITFYNLLNDKGFIIYPGKLTKADTFRIGNIGQLFPTHIQELLEAIKQVKKEMQLSFGPGY
jgi:2-aminoethylphosphonate-pyruvate transaminase